MNNQNGRRPKNITGIGKSAKRRGDGLGIGPVGSAGGYGSRPGMSGRPQRTERTSQNGGYSQRTAPVRAGGGSLKIVIIVIAALMLFGGGGFGLSNLFGGISQQGSSSGLGDIVNSLTGSSLMSSLGASTTSNGWDRASNTGELDKTVAYGTSPKRTRILGNGRDEVTIMVYMCGTDLESKGGMATNDLQEMAKAEIGKNVNLLVYTGGCLSWKNNVVSNGVNQIYKIETDGGRHSLEESMRCVERNMGSKAMTDPDTLAEFIDYCKEKYPANRFELILWDHGGGSLSGYGYDEKNGGSGSMTLPQLDKALSEAGVIFDFIGYDACLMATLETALTMEPYADYLIASEETEPGIGWYYTNWLTQLSRNTSMPTLDIGRNIVDDFVSTCDSQCRGQKTTLSVIDLAELAHTVPEKFKDFSQSAVELLQNSNFQQLSDARSSSREFAASSKLDQVDLVHLATRLGTAESEALAKALLGAVKYNRTSANMTNAYGLSIYFPYQKTSGVNTAVSTYEAIGLDSEYARCIQQFASMEVGGQAVSGGAASPLGSLLGLPSSSAAGLSSGDISQILGSLLGGNMMNVSGLTAQNSGFLGRSLDVDSASEYLSENMFDPSALKWTKVNGKTLMRLTDEQWGLINRLELNVFLDDGEGFVDLGLDNWYEFTDDGALIGTYDGTWLAVDQQPVAYYFIDEVRSGSSYTVTGRIPALLNGDRVDIIVVFDDLHPDGYIAGARSDYRDGETDTIAKGMVSLKEGDAIDFLCDFYSYDGEYLDSYLWGDTVYYHDGISISYVYVDADAVSAVYRFTDIYNQQYWSPEMDY